MTWYTQQERKSKYRKKVKGAVCQSSVCLDEITLNSLKMHKIFDGFREAEIIITMKINM